MSFISINAQKNTTNLDITVKKKKKKFEGVMCNLLYKKRLYIPR